jgi:hypothetical protein
MLWVESEGAGWYLFHPDDLAHRQDDPMDWPSHDFAIRKEFAAGTLIAIDTGADAGWFVRFTDEGLTDQERSHLLASVGFRLWVRHGCLCLDGGDALPFADPFPVPVQRSGTSVRCDEIELPDWAVPPPIDPDGYIPPEQPVWIDVPNGQYQAIVHTFDWGEQTGVERCPSYTVVLTPADEWEAIAHPQSIPCLIEGEGLIEISPAIEDVPPRRVIIPDTEYALFEWKTPVFPGIDLSFDLTSEQFQTLEKIARQYLRAKIFEHHIIMGYGLTEGRIGTFFHVLTFGNVYDKYFLKCQGKGRVRIVHVDERDGLSWARVEPFTAAAAVPEESVSTLKRAFAQYAVYNLEYRSQVPHHRFNAERIQALTDPSLVAGAIANSLNLPPDQLYQLLQLSDLELIYQLTSRLG